MGLKSMRPAYATLLAGMIIAALPGAATAESLAGKEGDKRHSVQFGQSTGPCQKAYQDYIAAPSHSAYAQTHRSFNVEALFCGPAYNAPSQKVAEERALAGCNSVGKKYKLKTSGKCTIYASK